MIRDLALKRYQRRIFVLSVVYVAALGGVEWLFARHALGGGLAYVAAVAPALPIIGMFAAFGAYLVAERDEYVRMLAVRQSLVATGFALAVATVWGFLESFGLAPHVPAYFIAVVWFASLVLGSLVNRWAAGRG